MTEHEYFISYVPSGWQGCPLYRCSIGFLTDEEFDYFVKKSNIQADRDFIPEGAYRLSLETIDGEAIHFVALEKFEEDCGEYRLRLEEHYVKKTPLDEDDLPSDLHELEHTQIMKDFQKIADEVRNELRPKNAARMENMKNVADPQPVDIAVPSIDVSDIIGALEASTESPNGSTAGSEPTTTSKELTVDIIDTFDENNGQWWSQNDFAKRMCVEVVTLSRYRERKSATFSKKNPLLGKDKKGNIFRKKSDKQNAECEYFVPYG